ncbi:MAG: energy-coupling factor transport system permease protein [Actinomycetota bacterium]|nr:energy-coupling factor transport system permease protein [Actinomycetota bacterium]
MSFALRVPRSATSAASAAGEERTAIHPGAWMAWATLGGIVAFTTTNPFYLLVLWAIAWFVFTQQRVPGPAARSFRVFLIAGLLAIVVRTALVFFGTFNAANVAHFAIEGLRLATILVIFGTFNAVTDPFGVVRLAPRRFHEPALAAALALSIAPRTVACLQRVREAQQLRGIPTRGARALPALAIPVLEAGMEEALVLAESMDSRGHGRGRRSRYRPQSWNAAAWTIALSAFVAAVMFWIASSRGLGDLQPGTDPLHWPTVNVLMLAAEALLVVPGFLPRQGSARR